ncbi:valine N-monooxygenase 1-like protein [Tanacetum coccineum]
MLRNKPTFRWIHGLMDQMNTKIVCIRLGRVHVIAVSDPKIACEFLKNNDEIFSSRPDFVSSYLTSNGYMTTILVPMGDHWKKMRKILATEILSVARHKWLQNKRDEEADNMIRYIYNRCHIDEAVTRGADETPCDTGPPGLGRNPEVWDDPLIFNPDRHLKDGSEVVLTDHSLRMLSFSTGRRGCPGVLLGSTMSVMLLARLVQGFTWELPPNEPYVDAQENLHDYRLKAKPLLVLAKPRLPHYLYPRC